MNYFDPISNQYGITIQDAKALANASAPEGSREIGRFVGYDDTAQPPYDPITHALAEAAPVQVGGLWVQQWSVSALPPEQVAINQAAKAAADALLIQSKIESLWASAERYTLSYISGAAIGILTIGVMQQNPKALAVSAWSSSVWAEYYQRKERVTADSSDDLDFSAFGPIPYTVPELQAEIGL